VRVNSPLLLREATPTDAPEIGDVHAEAWRVAHRDLFEPRVLRDLAEERRAAWPERLTAREHVRNTMLVAVRADRVEGFVRYGPHTDGPPDGEILDLYAHPTVWGGGIATNLVDRAWELMRDAGHPAVRLWTMYGGNRARHFYESFGFRESGRLRDVDYGDGRPVLEVEYVLNA
jgi:GNAT superfamily N-acetyltransferase